ncbi:MAG: hypothetical protein K2W96_22865 [Gemmataceae bacterium]|nr:hypothetical protein [Gemmataceae bacterium]
MAENESAPPKDPHLPALGRVGDLVAPRAPASLATAGVETSALTDLLLRFGFTSTRFTTDWIAKQMHLSQALVVELLTKMAHAGLIEQLWATSDANSHYKISEQGKDHAIRAMEQCGYIGPAPVGMDSYAAMLRWQFANSPPVQPGDVQQALSGMVLDQKAAKLAGLAVSSGRSLFIYGPSGNGKSSLGRALHAALPGDIWLPYAISLGESVVRLFDPHIHQRVEAPGLKNEGIDHRWVRARRPMVIVGGELTLEMLDLIYIPSMRTYEAPPHLKANGGVFLVDDFGRERITPEQLLNRFITPMEHQIDYFTLRTGQKIQVPLRHALVIATNLSPDKVTDPAFLRRMGYRVYLGAPTPEGYATIFKNYAAKQGVAVPEGMLETILKRYESQKRELRACEPRDLVERARDICRFLGKPLELTPAVLDLAWSGYFGE